MGERRGWHGRHDHTRANHSAGLLSGQIGAEKRVSMVQHKSFPFNLSISKTAGRCLPDISTSRSWSGGYDGGGLSYCRGRLSACTDTRQSDGTCGSGSVERDCDQIGREIGGCICFGLSRWNADGL